MAISLGSIVVELLANTASFQSGMTKASYEGKKAAKEIHESFSEMSSKIGGAAQEALGALGQFGSVAGGLANTLSEAFEGIGKSGNGIAVAVTALGGLGAAALGATAGIVELGKAGGELVEHFSLVSQRTGIGVRDLQVFEAAGKTVNVSLDDMVTGLRKFDQALLNTGKGVAAQGVLKELGITSRDNKEALLQTADAFSKMEDGARKNADAVALFGKGGLQLIPLLNKGRQGIVEWQDAVDKFGPIIGEKSVEALEKHKKATTELGLEYDRVKTDLESSVLPALTKLSNWFESHGGFQAVLAGLRGGRGAAASLKDQIEAQKAAAEAAKEESDQKGESLRKQEELSNALQKSFEVAKLGGHAAYELEQARLSLQGAVENGLWQQASAIQAQLPGLERAAQLEALRAEQAKRTAEQMERFKDFLANGAVVKPVLAQKPLEHRELKELFPNVDLSKNPLEGAPDLGLPEFAKNADAFSDLLKPAIDRGKIALDGFYAEWNKKSKGTVESINADYDKELAGFIAQLDLGEISQEKFKDVSLKIEAERQAGLKRLRQDTGASTFRDAWQDMFQEIEASGRDFARSITQDIGQAIEGLNQQLSRFIVTGKGLNLKQLGEDFSTNLVSSFLKKGESSLFGSLGNLFGLSTAKADGSSASNAFWVRFADANQLAGAGGIGGLNLSSVFSSSSDEDSGGGFFSKLFGSGSDSSNSDNGGILGFLGSIFGGGRAGGGDVQPGKAYIVGEKRPEIFLPKTAGTIVPSLAMSDGGKSVNVVNHFNINTPDADSFRKSQSQITSTMGSAIARGQQRNGR